LDQSRSEHRRGDAKNHIISCQLSGKVRLCNIAPQSIGTTRYREEIVHSAITRKPCFAHRTVASDERGNHIACTGTRRGVNLWIDGWTAAAHSGLSMASRAAIQIEVRAEALRYVIDLHKRIFGQVEKGKLLWIEVSQRRPRAGRASSNTRV